VEGCAVRRLSRFAMTLGSLAGFTAWCWTSRTMRWRIGQDAWTDMGDAWRRSS